LSKWAGEKILGDKAFRGGSGEKRETGKGLLRKNSLLGRNAGIKY